MADAGETTFVFKANTRPAEESVQQLEDKTISSAKKIGAAFAAYFIGGAFVRGLEKAIDAAVESEKAINQLNFAMQTSGVYTEQASLHFQEYASELQKTTGVSDDLIISSASLLVSIGKLSGDGLDKATKAALDLAAGLQIDVGSAFDIVTKATQGNVMALSKYGLEVNKNATDSEKFAAAIGFINSQFGGSSEAQMFTFAGAMIKIKNAVGDFFEEVGKLLTSSPALIAFLRTIAIEIENTNSKIAKKKDMSWMNTAINMALAFGYAIATVLERIHSLFMVVAGSFNYVIYGVFGPLIKLAGEFALAFGGLFETFGTDKVTAFGKAVSETGTEMTKFAYDSAAVVGQEVNNVFKGMTESTGTASQAIIDFQNTYTTEMDKVIAASKKVAGVHSETKKTVVEDSIKIGSTIVSTFANAMSTMAKNLAAGKGLFHNFGSMVLSLLGDLAIQMGTMIMSAGLAALALSAFSPAGMIAAGAGLIAVGSLLKAFFGSSSDTSASGGGVGGGGFGVGGGGNTFDTQTKEEERATPQTGVTVVVQGNVFDNKETGLQIANIINDAFDTNGTVIRAMA